MYKNYCRAKIFEHLPNALVILSGFLEKITYDETEIISNTPEPNGNSGTAAYSSDSAIITIICYIQ